jgi:hypothetical protein
MKTFSFASWLQELERAEMPPSARKSAEITIHWYLGYPRKQREPASIESARNGARLRKAIHSKARRIVPIGQRRTASS